MLHLPAGLQLHFVPDKSSVLNAAFKASALPGLEVKGGVGEEGHLVPPQRISLLSPPYSCPLEAKGQGPSQLVRACCCSVAPPSLEHRVRSCLKQAACQRPLRATDCLSLPFCGSHGLAVSNLPSSLRGRAPAWSRQPKARASSLL